jgi:L-arabinose transport system ATP-binding protein
MVGRKIEDVFRFTPRQHGEVALEVSALTGPGVRRPVAFSLRRGEILGFFGLVGSGRTELLKLLCGASRPTSGTIQIDGKVVAFGAPKDAIRLGIVLCPEDRKKDGIIPTGSVMENLNLAARRRFSRFGLLIREVAERRHAAMEVNRLAIKTPSFRQPIKLLSGGNQQKVILGRWLSTDVKVMLFDEPTRGIDVGAKSEIYSIIYRLAERGVAVIVVSSELPEVLGICDRVCVMRQGAISGCLARAEATQERVLELALPSAEAMEAA